MSHGLSNQPIVARYPTGGAVARLEAYSMVKHISVRRRTQQRGGEFANKFTARAENRSERQKISLKKAALSSIFQTRFATKKSFICNSLQTKAWVNRFDSNVKTTNAIAYNHFFILASFCKNLANVIFSNTKFLALIAHDNKISTCPCEHLKYSYS